MAKLTEIAEFINEVLRLEKNTPVKGYDPETEELGPSNQQAQVLANRTLWLKEHIESILEKYVISVNDKSGKVLLDYNDVGAEKKGLAATLLSDHVAEDDPHPQYLTVLKGNDHYVQTDKGNKPLGYLQLDAAGKIPANILDAFKSRYAVVETEAERLALPKVDVLTVCAQLQGNNYPDNQLFYLNAGEDPSVLSNWIQGESAFLGGVSSVFGRTGAVTAQNGDYNANQITETPERVFLSPIEKRSLADKQDLLVTGVTIKTLHEIPLLGNGDIKLDYNDVGADGKGTAKTEVENHLLDPDPHPQYVKSDDANNTFVKQSTANKALGYVQLTENGKLPAEMLESLKAQYVFVNTTAERLAIKMNDNLTIALQLNGPTEDDDQLWYLNGGLDPSLEENWVKGQSTTIVGVTSIFGRAGMVKAEDGDYNTDQITETPDRVFLSPEEKTAFAGKQEKLQSGVSIKTINDKPLLGEGNLDLTYSDVGGDKSGAGVKAVSDHEAKPNPHEQYALLEGANLPGGIVTVGENGKIDTALIEVFKSSVVVVSNKAARLALPKINDLRIAKEADTEVFFYLNGGQDPATEENWITGQGGAGSSDVTKVFNRIGNILAEEGDYNADQITETETRKFISPSEKETFAAVGTVAVTAHKEEVDPHGQYLNQERGDGRYVQGNNNNKAEGYLKLDAQNKIPAEYLNVIQARHVIVTTEAERLALEEYHNLTICVQLNGEGEQDDQLYYLNGDLDPSNPDNWVAGQSAIIQGVPSFNGRVGPIVPAQGDYNADQITETETRKFTTPAEKAGWSGKADKVHTHTAGQIVEFEKEVAGVIGSHISPGQGISVNYDSETGKTTVTATGSGSEGGGTDYIVSNKVGATAGQIHNFNFPIQSKFNIFAFALKSEAGKTNQTWVQETFPAAKITDYSVTDKVVFNNRLEIKVNGSYTLAQNGTLFESVVTERGNTLTITNGGLVSLIPPMTSASMDGYNVYASGSYSADAAPYYAFDGKDSTFWLSNEGNAPWWLRISLPKATEVRKYSIKNRADNYVSMPTSWKFQGSNDGNTWVDIESRTNSSNTPGLVLEFTLSTPVTYPHYRLLISTAAQNNVASISEFKLFGMATERFILGSENKYFYVDGSKTLQEITDPITADVINTLGNTSIDLTNGQQNTLGAGFKVISNVGFSVTTLLSPYAQIAIPNALTPTINWGGINSSTVSAALKGAGKLCLAASRDLVNWFVFKNAAWTSIGTLSPTVESAQHLIDVGMTQTEIGAITLAQWGDFYAAVDSQPDKIAFAYATSIPNALVDDVKITAHAISYNEVSSWKLQTPAEVEIRWYRDSMSFKTVAAGDYKLVYQAPK